LNRKARREAGSVLPSGARKATREMLAAAVIRDSLREEAQAADISRYSTTSPTMSPAPPSA